MLRVRPAPPTEPTDRGTLDDERTLVDLERCAVELAREAGARILAAASRAFGVQFKEPRAGHGANSNPVSDVDREVESFVRAELAARHPDHAVIGEEQGGRAGDAPIAWAVDPVDGTTNFVNGLALVASSFGVLRAGVPVAGAIWCGATHTLHPGVYHARCGGPLCFEGAPLPRRGEAPWRRLAAQPGSAPRLGAQWDLRVLGSAALELAYTAAGLLELAYLARPSLWDAAAGLVLLRAAGCAALERTEGGWRPLERFEGEIADWCAPLLAGAAPALARAADILER